MTGMIQRGEQRELNTHRERRALAYLYNFEFLNKELQNIIYAPLIFRCGSHNAA